MNVSCIMQAVCTFKILPSVGSILARSIADFQVRDNRETCRKVWGYGFPFLPLCMCIYNICMVVCGVV
jgi:hypothetical protein